MFEAHVTYTCNKCKKEETYPCTTMWERGCRGAYYYFERPSFGDDGDDLYPESFEEFDGLLLCSECKEKLNNVINDFLNGGDNND